MVRNETRTLNDATMNLRSAAVRGSATVAIVRTLPCKPCVVRRRSPGTILQFSPVTTQEADNNKPRFHVIIPPTRLVVDVNKGTTLWLSDHKCRELEHMQAFSVCFCLLKIPIPAARTMHVCPRVTHHPAKGPLVIEQSISTTPLICVLLQTRGENKEESLTAPPPLPAANKSYGAVFQILTTHAGRSVQCLHTTAWRL